MRLCLSAPVTSLSPRRHGVDDEVIMDLGLVRDIELCLQTRSQFGDA